MRQLLVNQYRFIKMRKVKKYVQMLYTWSATLIALNIFKVVTGCIEWE